MMPLQDAAGPLSHSPSRGPIARVGSRLAFVKAEQVAFLLLGLPMVMWLCFLTPLIQVPDEGSHLRRADQISQGQIFPMTTADGQIGGLVDSGMEQALAMIGPKVARTPMKEIDAFHEAAGRLHFSHEPTFTVIGSIVVYAPTFYLPQIAALTLAKAADLDIATSVRLVRVTNGLAASILCLVALGIARRGRLLMLVTSLLPMTLTQFGSASQDALMISSSLLLIAIFSRAVCEARPIGWGAFLVVLAVAVALTLSRPSMIFIAGLAFLPGVRVRGVGDGLASLALRATPAATALAALAVWSHLQIDVAATAVQHVEAAVSQPPLERAIYLVENPSQALEVGVDTLERFGRFYLRSMIGILGWLSIDLGSATYTTFTVLILGALVLDRSGGPASLRLSLSALAVLAALFVATFLVIYLVYAPIGTRVVQGVQGRYFLAFLPLAALCLPAISGSTHRAANLARFAVMFVPAVNFVIIPAAIHRFFFA